MKNIKLLPSLLFILAFTLSSTAQEKLIIPKETKRALNKKTRQLDGKPGENYWQNSSSYTITVSVDTDGHLSGAEKITYQNNSPDSLKTIVVRLYQDLFKKGVNRNAIVDVDPRDINDGVNISSLTVGGMLINLEGNNSLVTRYGTLMYIKLSEKLAPNTSVVLNIAWDFQIPKYTLIRMGTLDSSSFFVGQWYPQIAVYDDIRGWDTHSYNGLAEFHNDYANFDVEITVPNNFMVWATGEPQNLKDVLQPKYYKKYQKASVSDEIVTVITADDLAKGKITTDHNTWKYSATEVTDFAFGMSNHYLWDVTSVVVDKETKRKTIVDVAYKADAENFDKVAVISKESIKYLSEEMPGVPFPFPYLTAFNGDFGMEYPMITNVGAEADYGMTVYANSHEIAHTYFPFYVGTNETNSGWLDESLVVFMPKKIQKELEPEFDVTMNNTRVFSYYSGRESEPAVMTPTYYLDANIYFFLNYGKAEQALSMLELELGEELFKESLQEFMNRWKYKHPTPYDFFNTFNDVSEQNLNWFWQAWYFQKGGVPDLAIADVKTNGNEINLTIKNNGELPMPVVVTLYNNDVPVETITKPASVWVNNAETKISIETEETITNIKLGNYRIPDAKPNDNSYEMKE